MSNGDGFGMLAPSVQPSSSTTLGPTPGPSTTEVPSNSPLSLTGTGTNPAGAAALGALWAEGADPAASATQAYKAWDKTEITQLQRQLQRLGLYIGPLDGDLKTATEMALVEAFGSEEWRSMSGKAVQEKLSGARPPRELSAAKGQKEPRAFRYGELFKDGVVDLTLGVGFDEGGENVRALQDIVSVLLQRNFEQSSPEDPELQKIYAAAGRKIGRGTFGDFYVRKNALSYMPPVGGEPRLIHFTARIVASPDGSKGKEAAAAMKEGMMESDVAYYSGHGRYGTGPDFDANATFVYNRRLIKDYERLEEILEQEAGKGRAWPQFLKRIDDKSLVVNFSNAGNIVMNSKSPHEAEFGGKLMSWLLKNNPHGAAPSATTEGGELANSGNRKYQIYVFDGCRTKDYVTNIRKTPGRDNKQTDILATKKTVDWGTEAMALGAFLDGILGQLSANEVVTNMDGGRHAYMSDGLEDNPIHK